MNTDIHTSYYTEDAFINNDEQQLIPSLFSEIKSSCCNVIYGADEVQKSTEDVVFM